MQDITGGHLVNQDIPGCLAVKGNFVGGLFRQVVEGGLVVSQDIAGGLVFNQDQMTLLNRMLKVAFLLVRI